MLEKPVGNKHSSLLRTLFNHGRKKSYNIVKGIFVVPTTVDFSKHLTYLKKVVFLKSSAPNCVVVRKNVVRSFVNTDPGFVMVILLGFLRFSFFVLS